MGIKTLDELITELDNIIERFFEEEFYPDKITEGDK